MTKKFIILSLLFLCTSALYAEESSWKLRTTADGISVYTRQVEGSAILELKSNVIVNAPLEKVVNLFENEKQMPHWYHQCVQMELVEEENASSNIYYFALHLPFPVAERDAVLRRVKSEDPATGTVSFELTALPDKLDKRKKRIRVPYSKTTWHFTPLKDGTTEIYFQQHSDAGGSLPVFLANALVVDIPFHSLKNFRKLVEE